MLILPSIFLDAALSNTALSGALGSSDREQFEQMLAMDREIYKNLVSWNAFLIESEREIAAWEKGEKDKTKLKSEKQYTNFKNFYAKSKADYDREFASYNKRQEDYRNNRLYKLGKSISESTDNSIKWFKEFGKHLLLRVKTLNLSTFGAVPLLIPVVVGAGATVTGVAIAYFVKQHYTETANSLPRVAKSLEQISRLNPTLAQNIVDRAVMLEKEGIDARANAGFFAQLGKGAKWAIGIGGTVLVLGVGYGYLKSRNII